LDSTAALNKPALSPRVKQTLAELKVEPHPDKAYIGRVYRGFTFLGYYIASAGIVGIVCIAPQARKRFIRR